MCVTEKNGHNYRTFLPCERSLKEKKKRREKSIRDMRGKLTNNPCLNIMHVV